MRLVDRLVMKELLGPWTFGVGLFTALIMAGTYLGRLAGYVADQVPPRYIAELTGLLVPAILVKTFSMAVLLAALLAFGRLSSDSEIVALRAGGASIVRIVRPVIVFSVLIACVTFLFDESVVPFAASRSIALTKEVARQLRPDAEIPVTRAEVHKFKLRAFISAKNLNPATQSLQGVTVVAYDDKGEELLTMKAKELVFNGIDDWRVRGGATLISPDFKTVIRTDEIWPQQVPKLTTSFAELSEEGPPDFDAQSMPQLARTIAHAKAGGTMTRKEIANFEYGYWNKIATPLAAIVFGTLGAVLGIRGHRTGTASGFALAVAIIFGYVTIANFMNVWALNGVIPSYVASFAPLALGAVCAGIIMWRRNG